MINSSVCIDTLYEIIVSPIIFDDSVNTCTQENEMK